jgi:hypothetical protein
MRAKAFANAPQRCRYAPVSWVFNDGVETFQQLIGLVIGEFREYKQSRAKRERIVRTEHFSDVISGFARGTT